MPIINNQSNSYKRITARHINNIYMSDLEDLSDL